MKEALSSFHRFFRQPVEEIRHLPDWSWPRLILVHVTFTTAVAVLSFLTESITGIHRWSLGTFIFVIFSKSILTLITTLVSSAFFYYCLQLIEERKVLFRRLFITIFFAFLPFLVFQVFHEFFAPIDLLGFLFTAYLMFHGLQFNFAVPKGLALRLVVSLSLLFLLIWQKGRVDSDRFSTSEQESKVKIPEIKLGK